MFQWKAIFFDMDGTLLDSVASIGTLCNEVLERHGRKTHSLEAYKGFVGRGIRQVFVDATGEDEVDEMVAEFLYAYDENPLGTTKPYPGMVEVVKEAADLGILCFIVTNKAQSIAQKLSDGFFGEAVATVVGFQEGRQPKPSPEGIFELLATYQLKPEEVLFVGDSEVDFQTAQNAGVKIAMLSWGYAHEDFFKNHSPHYLCENSQELKKVIFSRKNP